MDARTRDRSIPSPAQHLFEEARYTDRKRVQYGPSLSGKGTSNQYLGGQEFFRCRELKATLQKGKSNPRWVAQSNTRVYEFVVQKQEQARLACHARSELALLSPSMAYTVVLDAIPIQSEAIGSEPDVRNRLFNLLIQRTSDTTPLPEALALARNFQVASKFTLVRDLQGAVTIRWASPQAEVDSSQGDTEQIEWKVVAPKQVWGMPVVPFTAEIAIDQRKVRNVSPDGKGESLLAASPRFPVDDGELRRVVSSVLSQADSDSVKLRKLLDWFADTKNMRYEGRVGSRYGTLVAFQQHHGRCWDYSDLFITMARIAGLPCRQVYGWLHESEGHVWCDVVVDGKWLMIDPTAAAPCDVGYLPFSVSDTGEFPMLYASQVSIQQTGVGSPFRGD